MREQQEQNSCDPSPSRSRPCNESVPINVSRGPSEPSPSPTPNPIPEQKPRSLLYTEKHDAAASAIQQAFRIHRSLRAISTIASEFQELKGAFVHPDVIDFQQPGSEGGHISVLTAGLASQIANVDEVAEEEGDLMEVNESQPKLAYTAANYPIHSYVDAMERLLMRLDGVESWGDKGVREKRRSIVREVGEEAAKLEKYWKQVWVDYVEKEKEKEKEESKEVEEIVDLGMETDEELVHVELPKAEVNDDWLDVAESEPDSGPHTEDGSRTSSLVDVPISMTD